MESTKKNGAHCCEVGGGGGGQLQRWRSGKSVDRCSDGVTAPAETHASFCTERKDV